MKKFGWRQRVEIRAGKPAGKLCPRRLLGERDALRVPLEVLRRLPRHEFPKEEVNDARAHGFEHPGPGHGRATRRKRLPADPRPAAGAVLTGAVLTGAVLTGAALSGTSGGGHLHGRLLKGRL
ncbi:pentapeptide repeat-containing protein [Arthrobacter sp. PAMC25284]|uniref:pentapeptide repeat-containing protein n=1 Tax=Arthrobacter sp. PAMC25284 TaxID=2861279 RepID=UPI0035BF53E2